MKKILSIATLAAALFWMPSPAQFLGPPNAYTRVTADTLADTSLFIVQVPSYGGSNTIKVRSITLDELATAVGSSIGDSTGFFDTVIVADVFRLNSATANTPARFDGSKNLVSGAYSGTGTTVMTNTGPTASNPTFTGIITGARMFLNTSPDLAGSPLGVKSGTDENVYVRRGADIGGGTGVGLDALNDANSAIIPFTVRGNPFKIASAAEITSTLAVTGNLVVNTNRFVVTAATGFTSSADTMTAVKFRAPRLQATDSVNTLVLHIGNATPITLNESDADVLTIDAPEYVEMTGNLVVNDRAGSGNRLAMWRADGTAGDTAFAAVGTCSGINCDSTGTGDLARQRAPDFQSAISITGDSAAQAKIALYPNNGQSPGWELRSLASGDSLRFYTNLGDTDNFPLTLTTTQGTFQGSIQTASPPTGTAAAWRFGTIIEDTCTLDATTYAEISIGGTFRKVALCQ